LKYQIPYPKVHQRYELVEKDYIFGILKYKKSFRFQNFTESLTDTMNNHLTSYVKSQGYYLAKYILDILDLIIVAFG